MMDLEKITDAAQSAAKALGQFNDVLVEVGVMLQEQKRENDRKSQKRKQWKN